MFNFLRVLYKTATLEKRNPFFCRVCGVDYKHYEMPSNVISLLNKKGLPNVICPTCLLNNVDDENIEWLLTYRHKVKK